MTVSTAEPPQVCDRGEGVAMACRHDISAIRLPEDHNIEVRRKPVFTISGVNPSLLPSLAWFALVARHCSFTKAAAEMGVSRAALSQNLKALEKQLGTRLLYRTTRDMSLTEAGQRLLDSLRPSLAAIELALRDLDEASGEPSGVLRVNTARVAARHFIEPHLPDFLARYPRIVLELTLDDGLSNILAEGCDGGIRLGESLAEHMIAVPITPPLELAVVGAPDYFRRHGSPMTPSDLVHHHCINLRYRSGGLHNWEFANPESEHEFTVEVKGRYIVNDDDGMLRAALQGVGLVQHINVAVQDAIRDGRLVRVLRDWCPAFPGFYLYAPSREQMPLKLRAFLEFLVEKRDTISLL
ncbi:LysR family transcriptional regulator [Stenotrophomonas acidaminiphila]|uniref:LysR family transcriptional regulator n=1 Tax=Stenotrophomonas acidaminiphila TaxID=128780 RepID=UPI0028AD3974|nr:LysR family transcriptional regulator [Stenotrophomonas acidaminiphila]